MTIGSRDAKSVILAMSELLTLVPDHPLRSEYQALIDWLIEKTKRHKPIRPTPSSNYHPLPQIVERRNQRIKRNEKILELWRGGFAISEIAEQFGISRGSVVHVVKNIPRGTAHGEPRRYKQQKSPEQLLRIQRMTEARASGKTFSEIASQESLSRERVRKLLNSMPRPKKQKVRNERSWRGYLHRKMLNWLREAGYATCDGACKQWMDANLVRHRRCRTCNAELSREIYRSNPEYRQRALNYRRSEHAKRLAREAYRRRKAVKSANDSERFLKSAL